MENIKIKYFNKDYPELERIEGEKSDWIDLRVDTILKYNALDIEEMFYDLTFKEFHYEKGDIIQLGLGVAMELPKGYEAIVAPRSSTFKHWGLMLTNSIGVIDNSYNGDGDEWKAEFVAMKDGVISRFDRVCQFRIQKKQPEIEFTSVENLHNKDRGGFGTTGKR